MLDQQKHPEVVLNILNGYKIPLKSIFRESK